MSLENLYDFEFFASNFFQIRSKSGEVKPLILNRAQKYILDRLDKQLKSTGKVRAVCLKGRQQGCSTFIQARFAHKILTNRGTKAYILTHETEATQNLFEMTRRFIEHLPNGLAPEPDQAASTKLHFKSLDSGYAVGTAGNKGAGRSQTLQLFHGCLESNTPIYDVNTGGIKPIKDFMVGDLVLTHTGQEAPISFISTQQKECLQIKLRTLTAFPLQGTPQHRFWTKKGWTELKDLKLGDSIGYPIKEIRSEFDYLNIPIALKRIQHGGRQFNCPDTIKLDYKLGLLIGLYLAEGHIKKQIKYPFNYCYISFSVHRKEVDRTIEWLLPFKDYYSSMNIKHRDDSLTSVITIYGSRFANFVNDLCGRTTQKHIPFNWHKMGSDFCRGLLHGYISGDGASYESDRRIRASSICSAITISLRDIAASLGYGWASIEFKKAGFRYSRNEKDRYTFALCGNGASLLANEIGKPSPIITNVKTSSIKEYAAITTEISNGYAWLRIRSIEEVGLKTVYDFEIDHEDHSYCTIHGATHNSEVAFWPHAEEHAKGVMQAIPREHGTEIILESTANGIGNFFYTMWQTAMSGASEYQAIFVPWYWQEEYKISIPGFVMNDEEEELYHQFKNDGLTIEHINWRRIKIAEFNGTDFELGLEQFKQEYPMTASEAFRNPIADTFINALSVLRARKAKVESDAGLIIGVDPALGDRDAFAIIRRKGRKAYRLERHKNHNTMQIAGVLRKIIDNEKPVKLYIDVIGIGAGIVDRLLELGYSQVEGINSARNASDKTKYANKRAEMWAEMREWLNGESPVQIPDSDILHGDLCSLGYRWTSNGQLMLEGKDQIKKRGLPSPDCGDALALTFSGGFYDISQEADHLARHNFDVKGKFY